MNSRITTSLDNENSNYNVGSLRRCEPAEEQFGLNYREKKSKKTISEFLVEASPSYHPTPNSLQVDLMQIVDIKEARDSDILRNRGKWRWNMN